jgi:hypothetical protein
VPEDPLWGLQARGNHFKWFPHQKLLEWFPHLSNIYNSLILPIVFYKFCIVPLPDGHATLNKEDE